MVRPIDFYDQHCHTRLSFDSKAQPVDYVGDHTQTLVFTDHLELSNPITKRDDIPDFDELIRIKEKLKADYGVEVLMGVEIGYVQGREEDIRKILDSYDFDIKILSSHQNRDYDYMDRRPDLDPRSMVDSYVNQLIKSLDHFKDCQIFAHLDYGFRVHDLGVEDIKAYEEEFIYIFKNLVKNDIGLELNSKSIYNYKKIDLYTWAIGLYKSLGGKLFVLGSDCHKAKDKGLYFDKLIAYLQDHGIKELALYKNQRPSLVPIDQINLNYL